MFCTLHRLDWVQFIQCLLRDQPDTLMPYGYPTRWVTTQIAIVVSLLHCIYGCSFLIAHHLNEILTLFVPCQHFCRHFMFLLEEYELSTFEHVFFVRQTEVQIVCSHRYILDPLEFRLHPPCRIVESQLHCLWHVEQQQHSSTIILQFHLYYKFDD